MLKHLHIKNFTIITELELELDKGLTVMTGETGAGKSILIDALQIVLGGRAETSLIRQGGERCEITAIFAIQNFPAAHRWLVEQEMEEDYSCIIRRTFARDGRMRSTINGHSASLQQIRTLGELLVHIHGQNQHSSLVKTDYQRELLDNFSQHEKLTSAVRHSYQKWRQLQQDLLEANRLSNQDHSIQKELLTFQLQEFAQLNLQENEFALLEQEHQRLAHAEKWLISHDQALSILCTAEEGSVIQGLQVALQQLQALSANDEDLTLAIDCLQQASLQTEESIRALRQFARGLEADPQRLHQVEQRLRVIHDLARKHRVEPAFLLSHQMELQQQLQQLSQLDGHFAHLQQQLAAALDAYITHAQQLTASRQKYAKKLSALVTEQMQSLGLPNGQFMVQCNPLIDADPHKNGAERVEFWVNMNPGQPLQPLNKVASGGELSRISLAIQVITAQTMASPSLIFDEVDVGIGGGTAELVGQQLRQLGQAAQVFCVTHLPQVAAKGDHHLHVEKRVGKDSTDTIVRVLPPQGRVAELARMLGGVTITETTLAHAQEMLELESLSC